MRVHVSLVTVALCLSLLPAAGAGDPVMKAMEEELGRSTTALQMEDLSKPYFVAYRVDEVATSDCAATFGSLVRSDSSRNRLLEVEVRVGSAALDNTNFLAMPDFGGGNPFGAGTARLPLDDSELEIRRQLWLATDAAYKAALENLAKKKAALQNKTRTDDIPDFASQEPGRVEAQGSVPALGETARAAELARRLSALFREMPEVSSSEVRLRQTVVVTRYANSEGSRFVRVTPEVRLLATASTQAPDGMPLADFVYAASRDLGGLPPVEELEKQVKTMGARLTALRQAALLDSYNGPVLFEGQAAAELLAQAFVPRLLASRDPVAENPQLEMFLTMGRGEGPWVDKIGARVLPRSLSLADDPTLGELGGAALLGGYSVDDDAVPARRTELVAAGTLKTLLSTRTPVRGVPASSGNRRGAGPAPSNLVLASSEGVADAELRAQLLTLVADRGLEYGVIVRRVSNPVVAMVADPLGAVMSMLGGGGQQQGVQPAVEAVKVFADGHEEPLRNVELGDVSAAAFKDIVAAGATPTVTSLPFQVGGGSGIGFFMSLGEGRPGDAAPLVSVATPPLLFEELTLKKPSGEVPRPPVAPHPFFAPRK